MPVASVLCNESAKQTHDMFAHMMNLIIPMNFMIMNQCGSLKDQEPYRVGVVKVLILTNWRGVANSFPVGEELTSFQSLCGSPNRV